MKKFRLNYQNGGNYVKEEIRQIAISLLTLNR